MRHLPGRVFVGFAWFFALAATVRADQPSDESSTPCERTAQTMLRACLFGAGEALQTTIAQCKNLSGSEERDECVATARAARSEDGDECTDIRDARSDVCELLGELRYDTDPLLAPASRLIDPDDVPSIHRANPYVSVAAGHTYVLRAGEDGEEINVVHVTSDVREIQGALCRVVVDVVVEESDENGEAAYDPIEVTDDWFAQDASGNVYYCGEATGEYEDGVLRDIAGSFEAGRDGAKGGYLSKAAPTVGDSHREEFALGEGEDVVEYLSLAAGPSAAEGGDNPAFPCRANRCLRTLELTALDPGVTEHKYYLAGTGQVLTVGFEDGIPTGDREELVCVGESLDVLETTCDIADPEELLATLCRLRPEAFCEE